MTKITVKDAEDKQVLVIEYDAENLRGVLVSTKAGSIEITVSEGAESDER